MDSFEDKIRANFPPENDFYISKIRAEFGDLNAYSVYTVTHPGRNYAPFVAIQGDDNDLPTWERLNEAFRLYAGKPKNAVGPETRPWIFGAVINGDQIELRQYSWGHKAWVTIRETIYDLDDPMVLQTLDAMHRILTLRIPLSWWDDESEMEA